MTGLLSPAVDFKMFEHGPPPHVHRENDIKGERFSKKKLERGKRKPKGLVRVFLSSSLCVCVFVCDPSFPWLSPVLSFQWGGKG